MKLHTNKELFEQTILQVAQKAVSSQASSKKTIMCHCF